MIFRHGFVNQLNARVKKTRSCALYTVHTPLIAPKHYQTPAPWPYLHWNYNPHSNSFNNEKEIYMYERTFLSTCLNTKRIIHFFLCFLNEVIKITMCSIQVKSSNARTYLIKGWQKNQFSCVDINNCYPLARWESNKALLPTDLETVMYSQSLMNALTRHYYSS